MKPGFLRQLQTMMKMRAEGCFLISCVVWRLYFCMCTLHYDNLWLTSSSYSIRKMRIVRCDHFQWTHEISKVFGNIFEWLDNSTNRNNLIKFQYFKYILMRKSHHMLQSKLNSIGYWCQLPRLMPIARKYQIKLMEMSSPVNCNTKWTVFGYSRANFDEIEINARSSKKNRNRCKRTDGKTGIW